MPCVTVEKDRLVSCVVFNFMFYGALLCYAFKTRAFSSNLRKRSYDKIGKKITALTTKLGEINNIEHNKGC